MMNRSSSSFLPSLVCVAIALIACCSNFSSAQVLPPSCSGTPNTLPVVDFDLTDATPIATVANGSLYSILPSSSSTPLLVLQVYGDSYSQGYAYGQLLEKQLLEVIPAAYAYFTKQFNVPTWLVNEILDLTRNTTKLFTPQHHFDFMQGISDGTGNTTAFLDIWRLAMIPEAIKATCSIVGAHGQATANGGLIQLRALDWGTDGPFQQWPLLTTFHPNDGSFTHTALGWVGMYGTITGYSSSNMAVSEKVWYAYKGLDNIIGYPWTLMLQDIMRYDVDVDAALSRIGNAVKTCAIWIGVGQGARPSPNNPNATLPARFNLVESSFQQLHFFNSENFPFYKNHDYFPDLAFVNRHVQPSDEPCMNDIFHGNYGNLTSPFFYEVVTALEQTGNMHIAVMDFDAKQLFVGNASPNPNSSPAYNNGFIHFNMKQMWDATLPADV